IDRGKDILLRFDILPSPAIDVTARNLACYRASKSQWDIMPAKARFNSQQHEKRNWNVNKQKPHEGIFSEILSYIATRNTYHKCQDD
ncbi:MAG: hypothetical protein PHD54_14890, partial [Desulfuromonadaceae bacterium]|nr:hypothetical protein [Desulfuromonadaceae bacterium]